MLFKCLNLICVDLQFSIFPFVSIHACLKAQMGEKFLFIRELFPDLWQKGCLIISLFDYDPVYIGAYLFEEVIGIGIL